MDNAKGVKSSIHADETYNRQGTLEVAALTPDHDLETNTSVDPTMFGSTHSCAQCGGLPHMKETGTWADFMADPTYQFTLPSNVNAMSYPDALKSGPFVAPSYPTIPPCKLLGMPAEIRNDIFELVFTADSSSEEEVDLLAARAPSGNLLRTSSKIYAGAKGFYATGRAAYWSTTSFIIERKDKTAKAALTAIPNAALQKITKLKLKLPITGTLSTKYVFGRAPEIATMGTTEWLPQVQRWEIRSENRAQYLFHASIQYRSNGHLRIDFSSRNISNREAPCPAATRSQAPGRVAVPMKQQIRLIFALLEVKVGSRV
ncbi:unnamed protein product [Zymoseptoria tritici ST99CH_3D1]|nr:unnamed protein product [Zymoseptoria tritici ST99CH_3D1]